MAPRVRAALRQNGVEFATPALPYDHALKLRIT
jgi:hypothetical protein